MDAPGTACRHFTVTGRVQGVFFRDSTRRKAEALGLTGYAKNRPDGSVEVLACGPADSLDRLGEWLQEGPGMAAVDSVQASPLDDVDPPPDFTIL
jgi:acylphosphatase